MQGLEPTELMLLKRVPPPPPTLGGRAATGAAGTSSAAAPEPFISRHAGGMCFDFSGQDGRTYLVGEQARTAIQRLERQTCRPHPTSP